MEGGLITATTTRNEILLERKEDMRRPGSPRPTTATRWRSPSPTRSPSAMGRGSALRGKGYRDCGGGSVIPRVVVCLPELSRGLMAMKRRAPVGEGGGICPILHSLPRRPTFTRFRTRPKGLTLCYDL